MQRKFAFTASSLRKRSLTRTGLLPFSQVHTQARDVGYMVKESAKKAEAEGKKGFYIESVRAADLFSQTHHAEGLCILRREI